MKIKSLYGERDLQWWGFTLLPILIIIPIVLVYNWKFRNANQILLLLLQQLSAYSIILSSTDLGLKFKSKDKLGPIFFPLIIIIFASILLTCVYMFQEDIINSTVIAKIFFLILVICFVSTSIGCYYKNPESFDISPKTFTTTKELQERQAKERFKSPKADTKVDIQWGE